jgi:hypothetical protein
VLSGLLTVLSLIAAVLGAGLLGVLAIPAALLALTALLVYTLRRVSESAPSFPRSRPSPTWLREVARFLWELVEWAAPHVSFVAPFIVFVAVTWPLASESASIQFQQQASEIIPVLLIGFVIETGAIRWRNRPVNWILGLMTVLILVAGETYAFIALATDKPDHADVIAGSMAAGLVAILIAAIQGSVDRGGEGPGDAGQSPAGGTTQGI